jgi:hypothetical protein
MTGTAAGSAMLDSPNGHSFLLLRSSLFCHLRSGPRLRSLGWRLRAQSVGCSEQRILEQRIDIFLL